MDDILNEKLQEIEAEWEVPLYQRLLKVVVLGAVTLTISWLAEGQYDAQLNRLKERKRNARSRTHV